jgi:glycosyltransferase involved in cell wall biosynthesis
MNAQTASPPAPACDFPGGLRFWPVGPLRHSDVQGHHLLSAKLAARLRVARRGWGGSFLHRLVLKLCRGPFRLRGVDPDVAWGLLIGNHLTRRGVHGRERVHWIWGDHLPERAQHPEACIFSIHQPLELWTDTQRAALPRCGGVLAMSQRECDHLRALHPGLHVDFIPLGVDTDYWQPAPAAVRDHPKQICAIGRYLRNFDMLVRVSAALLASESDLVIRWLVNPDFVMPPELEASLPPERFQVVRHLSSAELRQFYQESWLFFTPYGNVTASNAIVETMACGVPVFTTRVGGMESYVRDAGVLVKDDDDAAMLAAIRECLHSRERRDMLSAAARALAEQHLAWPVVVERHLEFYRALATRQRGAA